jgi:hypothetical protein
MTFSITTFIILTFSITAFSIAKSITMTFSTITKA